MSQPSAWPGAATLRRTGRIGVLLAALLLSMFTGTVAAHATARNGVCDPGEFCYYYNSNEQNAISDFTSSVADYGTSQPSCYEFKGSSGTPGAGQCIKNNAASVWNRASVSVTVYVNSNYGSSEGSPEVIAPGERTNLHSTYNNEASHRFGSSGGTVTGAQAVARAQVWVDKHIPYDQGSTYQGYRKDCSGYVSMAWGLPTPGLVTNTMPGYGSYISKSSLKQGDALLNSASGNAGHVVLFDKWANSAHSSYWGYEESGSHGAIHRVITYPYYSGYGTFKPFRYRGLK